MKIYWTLNAIQHLTNIYEYISLNSPTYARRTVELYRNVSGSGFGGACRRRSRKSGFVVYGHYLREFIRGAFFDAIQFTLYFRIQRQRLMR